MTPPDEALSQELSQVYASFLQETAKDAEKVKNKEKKKAEIKSISKRQRELRQAYRAEAKRQDEAKQVANLASFKSEKEKAADLAEKELLPQITEIFMEFCEQHKGALEGVKVVLHCSQTGLAKHFSVSIENNPIQRTYYKPTLEKIAHDYSEFCDDQEEIETVEEEEIAPSEKKEI